jgi:hypothetical protein
VVQRLVRGGAGGKEHDRGGWHVVPRPLHVHVPR